MTTSKTIAVKSSKIAAAKTSNIRVVPAALDSLPPLPPPSNVITITIQFPESVDTFGADLMRLLSTLSTTRTTSERIAQTPSIRTTTKAKPAVKPRNKPVTYPTPQLRTLRVKQGLTLHALACQAQLSIGTLVAAEHGKSVTVRTARKLAAALHVSLKRLTTDTTHVK